MCNQDNQCSTRSLKANDNDDDGDNNDDDEQDTSSPSSSATGPTAPPRHAATGPLGRPRSTPVSGTTGMVPHPLSKRRSGVRSRPTPNKTEFVDGTTRAQPLIDRHIKARVGTRDVRGGAPYPAGLSQEPVDFCAKENERHFVLILDSCPGRNRRT